MPHLLNSVQTNEIFMLNKEVQNSHLSLIVANLCTNYKDTKNLSDYLKNTLLNLEPMASATSLASLLRGLSFPFQDFKIKAGAKGGTSSKISHIY